MVDKLPLSEEEWRRRLSPEEYRVLPEHGTEPAGSGCLLQIKGSGHLRVRRVRQSAA